MLLNSKVRPIRFWSQKVLPLVYDDSLSYYEVLSKVAHKLNELIGVINTVTFSEVHYNENDRSISFITGGENNG